METQVHTRWQFVWRCAGLRILWDSSMQQRNGDCCGTGSRTSLFNDCHQGLHMIPLIEGHDYFVWNIEWEQIPEVDVLPAPKNICRKKRQVLVTQQNQNEEKDTSRICANRIAVTQFSSSCVRSLCNKKSCVLLTAQLLSLSFPIYVSHTG